MSASKALATSDGSVQVGCPSTQAATLSGSTTSIFLTFLRKSVTDFRASSRSSGLEVGLTSPEAAWVSTTTFFPFSGGHGGRDRGLERLEEIDQGPGVATGQAQEPGGGDQRARRRRVASVRAAEGSSERPP